jgi:hypothetical protein
VTIAKRPFVWAGMARDKQVIWVKKEQEYFCKGELDNPNQIESKGEFFSAVIPGRAKHEPRNP